MANSKGGTMPAKIIGFVDPAKWTKTVGQILLEASEEFGHRADIYAKTKDGKSALPECHVRRYDFTTRVWRRKSRG
jgi:hypothetical protein